MNKKEKVKSPSQHRSTILHSGNFDNLIINQSWESNYKLLTLYELYDGQYPYGPEKAMWLSACRSLEKAKEQAASFGANTLIVKSVNRISGNELEEISSEILY